MTAIITAFERPPDGGMGLARDTRGRWALEAYYVRLVFIQALKEPGHLALHPFGQIPTHEDFMTVSVLLRCRMPGLLDEFPNLAAYVARGEARPAYRRAFAAQALVNATPSVFSPDAMRELGAGEEQRVVRSVDGPLATSLAAVGDVMKTARDPWWIIGSAAVALHGVDPGPIGDVDVLLSVVDAMRMFPSIGMEPRAGSDHADFRSAVFGRWTVTALPVEFMAGFCHRSGSEWISVHPATRQRMVLGDVDVFVPDREELCWMLFDFGRPKDLERAHRLDA